MPGCDLARRAVTGGERIGTDRSPGGRPGRGGAAAAAAAPAAAAGPDRRGKARIGY